MPSLVFPSRTCHVYTWLDGGKSIILEGSCVIVSNAAQNPARSVTNVSHVVRRFKQCHTKSRPDPPWNYRSVQIYASK